MSPNNWGSTALIIVIKPAASIFLLLVNYHILLLEMVFFPDKSTIQKIKCKSYVKKIISIISQKFV